MVAVGSRGIHGREGPGQDALPASETMELPTAEIDAVRLQPDFEATALEWSRIRGQKSAATCW